MQSRTVQIAAPLAGVAFATLIRHLLHPYVGPLFPFFSYFLVVIICALYGGAVPGAIALVAGYLAGSFFFVGPPGSVIPNTATDWFGVIFYFLNGSITVILAERQRLARLEAKGQAARSEASEKALQKSLHEIEMLNHQLQRAMAETHHRVKNNLQVISAMVDIQTMQQEEAVPKHGLVMIANHIRGLAAIHDLLTQQSTQGDEVNNISVGDAFLKLIPILQEFAGSRALKYDAGNVRVPIRQAGAIIVAANELISNAVKHGQGDIEVVLAASNGVGTLTVSDCGTGFPADFGPTNASAGLNLVRQIIQWDLQGEISYQNRKGGGAVVVVNFPVATDEYSNPPALAVRTRAGEPVTSAG